MGLDAGGWRFSLSPVTEEIFEIRDEAKTTNDIPMRLDAAVLAVPPREATNSHDVGFGGHP